MRLVPDWSRGRHRLAKPITDYCQAKPMPMTISMTTFDTQLKISFIVYNITLRRLVLKEFWTCLMIKSLYTDAALRYLLGLICRVIFCCLSSHSRSLFSVIVSLCSKIETVCNKRSRNEYKSLSLTLKKCLAFQHKLIHLHVAWNLCLVSVQQKPHIRLFMTFSRRGHGFDHQSLFQKWTPSCDQVFLFPGGGGREKEQLCCFHTIPLPPSLPPPQTKKKTAWFRLNECMLLKGW